MDFLSRFVHANAGFLRACAAFAAVVVFPAAVQAQDLCIRDRPAAEDNCEEPFAGSPLYTSPDIWVRRDPDPNYDPAPFPSGAPPWAPLAHQNPEYRDTLTGMPNYIYVRVHNVGREASSGTERLRVYQAKAGTGLAWPNTWVDFIDMACGEDLLHGIEVTKPRRNAADLTNAERTQYLNALLALQNDPAMQFSDGVTFWRKQNEIHSDMANSEHGNPAFLPWHREMMNRFEALLQKSDPLVKLPYWDWRNQHPKFDAPILLTENFMGTADGNVTGLVVGPGGLEPSMQRNTNNNPGAGFGPDSALTGIGNYPAFAVDLEEVPFHNRAHGFIGQQLDDNIRPTSTSATDPFFYLLHGNVDRIWAVWQRDPDELQRLDSVATYGGNSGNGQINGNMSPWDGTTGLAPWAGGTAYLKDSKHRSVVNPPVYDTAPLTIPVLQPGESVVIEVPWFPPNVNDFDCMGGAGHFCLLARIETDTAPPFGMTVAEGAGLADNVRNNNNIAWKNVTVVDETPEMVMAMMRLTSGTTVRNVFERPAEFVIRLVERTPDGGTTLFRAGLVTLVLPPEILKQVEEQGDDALKGFKITKDEVTGEPVLVAVEPDPQLRILLKPGQKFVAGIRADLPADLGAKEREIPFVLDIEQLTRREQVVEVLGGVRFEIDLRKLNLIAMGGEWLNTPKLDLFAEEEWPEGFEATAVDAPYRDLVREAPVRLYMQRFELGSPDGIETLRLSAKAHEAMAVFLNGKEIFRHNLPEGDLGGMLESLEPVDELDPNKADRLWIRKVDPDILREGTNVVAALVVGRKGGEIGFDLGLTANDIVERPAPDLSISTGPDARTTFSPGEPIPLTLLADARGGSVSELSLHLNGGVAVLGSGELLSEQLKIDEPGLYRLEGVVVDDAGQRASRQMRVLVVENIPPNVGFATPAGMTTVAPGDTVTVVADVDPAFEREIISVALYAKLGDDIPSGFNLVRSDVYPVIDERTEAPFELTFEPEQPGMYMLQLGAVDDVGAIGVSRHIMVMVQ